MHKVILTLIATLVISSANAQIHEIGGFVGGSNYIGDIGSTQYIAPNKLAFGILYKWNKSPRHAWRFSYIQTTIIGDDSKSDNSARNQRDMAFENAIKEFSAGMEFNFLDFNLHLGETKISPYVYTGATYFAYSENFYLAKTLKADYENGQFAIPMIIGIKTNVLENWVIGAEVGARYTLTDNLDGTNPKNDNLAPLRFGNQESNDWYVFSGITLTYTFGIKPCYCH
jgi:hypothetical protein